MRELTYRPEERLKECKEILAQDKCPIYRHWKGKLYAVIGIAKDADCLESVVVYQEVNTEDVWTRLAMEFFENVNKKQEDGKRINRPRFTFMDAIRVDELLRVSELNHN